MICCSRNKFKKHGVRNSHCVKSVQTRSFLWSVFFRIQTEYVEILRISPHSVQRRKNTDQKKLRLENTRFSSTLPWLTGTPWAA